MASEKYSSTIHLIVRDESFELPLSLFKQFLEYTSLSGFKSDHQHGIHLNIDPSIFNAYLLYLQTGCFLRVDHYSEEHFIDELKLCGAPSTLIRHYKHCDLVSAFSPRHSSPHSTDIKKENWQRCLILIGLFFSTCMLTIDLYRQVLIFNQNSYREISKLLVILIYSTDSLLFIYSSIDGIIRFLTTSEISLHIILNLISCLGIVCYFTIQRPIDNVIESPWNSVWIFIHLCRTVRLVQIGSRLIDIRWCFEAITQCLRTFLQTLTALFWIFIFSGSILYTVDLLEDSHQYSSILSTIFSVHETLYTIGYRNNPPNGFLTRFWTLINIYFLSSLVQILLWWFQTKVTLQWNELHRH